MREMAIGLNPTDLMTGAVFSDDGKYRYALWRFWNYQAAKDGNARAVMFIMGNPSTAGQFKDDPTSIKCAKFAQRWGYDGIYIGNLYATVDTYSLFLKATKNDCSPWIGDDCDKWLMTMQNSSLLHVAAWGFIGNANPTRTLMVKAMFPMLHHLGISKNGQPKHPLYLPASTEPTPWE